MSVRAVSPITEKRPARRSRIDAGGTTWRLRSLIAMGHDCSRIARALHVDPNRVRRLVAGHSRSVTPAFHDHACQLWNLWWDKTPPRHTPAERRAAALALRQAERNNWPAAVGLDEELLDEPGYRPWSRYRPAAGTGDAPDVAAALAAARSARPGSPAARITSSTTRRHAS